MGHIVKSESWMSLIEAVGHYLVVELLFYQSFEIHFANDIILYMVYVT